MAVIIDQAIRQEVESTDDAAILIAVGVGADGEKGSSAYEVAVQNGFIGSEESWIESLKGVAKVSSDADNMTTTGSDGGVYTPDVTSDLLAYYILAKS